MAKKSRREIRDAVHRRIRKKVKGTADRPRLCLYRSLKHIYAQLIADDQGSTLAAASTLDQSIGVKASNTAAAREVGKLIAARAMDQGIKQVIFDRGGYRYHGRVKALAEAARESGLQF
ncbi:MAG: 50S ribosomal protein L18 [Acidobacteria bacterium]|nr:50S ribosomal protein L18 [Acidobacteriota bacterium]